MILTLVNNLCDQEGPELPPGSRKNTDVTMEQTDTMKHRWGTYFCSCSYSCSCPPYPGGRRRGQNSSRLRDKGRHCDDTSYEDLMSNSCTSRRNLSCRLVRKTKDSEAKDSRVDGDACGAIDK